MTQSQALNILRSGANVFLTGSAGTGKTFLLNRFIEGLKRKKIGVGVTASTGIAATHLNGRTIHSWVGMGIAERLGEKELRKLAGNEELRERIRRTRTLIIDEISMLDAARLNLVDRICRTVREPFKPFGGLQVVLCGDFFQLPPVDREKKTQLCYEAMAWQQSDIQVCYLTEQFRQKDAEFIGILNSIRANAAGARELSTLKRRLHRPFVDAARDTKLYTHNIDVDAINDSELRRLPGKESNYTMTHYGPAELVTVLKKSCLAPKELRIKVGALVIFVKNNFDAGYVNGTLAKVVAFDENDGYPIVCTRQGRSVVAVPGSWNIEEDDRVIASIRQVPLRLAWAITIHKSQGMSLDAAEIDLSKTFECGMGYVALSRVRRLNSIRLLGINNLALRVNPQVVDKDKEFQQLSRQAERIK